MFGAFRSILGGKENSEEKKINQSLCILEMGPHFFDENQTLVLGNLL